MAACGGAFGGIAATCCAAAPAYLDHLFCGLDGAVFAGYTFPLEPVFDGRAHFIADASGRRAERPTEKRVLPT